MKNVAVVFWSGTGNTEAMAEAVAKGARTAGAAASVIPVGSFDASQVAKFDAFAFGCPAMGSEALEESEFEPVFEDVKGSLAGKSVALFGSYGSGATASGCAPGKKTAPTRAFPSPATASSAATPPTRKLSRPAGLWVPLSPDLKSTISLLISPAARLLTGGAFSCDVHFIALNREQLHSIHC